MPAPYSEFRYIDVSELATYILTISGITNSGLAAAHVTAAEQVIDAYVGPGWRFYPEVTGNPLVATSGTSLQADVFGDSSREPNYWAHGGLYVEVLSNPSGPGAVGEGRLVVASSGDTVTLATAFSATLGTDAEFRTYQRSAFPRAWHINAKAAPFLPHELKVATAYQVEYGMQAGGEAFGLSTAQLVTDERGGIQSESYGSGYSYSRDSSRVQGLAVYLAPRARVLLRRLINSTGHLVG